VLIFPGYAEVLPDQTEVSGQITTIIRLNIPLVSAAMDTMTEAHLAITLAREGGIGIIHCNQASRQFFRRLHHDPFATVSDLIYYHSVHSEDLKKHKALVLLREHALHT